MAFLVQRLNVLEMFWLVLVSKVFLGFPRQNRPDLFPLPVWGCPRRSVWPVSETGLTSVGCQQLFWVVFRCLCCCWLDLTPRSSSTPVATWIWQEKFAEVSEWFWVHRPNSWVEFLSAPIYSSPLWFAVRFLHVLRHAGHVATQCNRDAT
jgi:hypothetical protein